VLALLAVTMAANQNAFVLFFFSSSSGVFFTYFSSQLIMFGQCTQNIFTAGIAMASIEQAGIFYAAAIALHGFEHPLDSDKY